METDLIAPVVQYGFAGFCAALIAIMAWLVKQMLASQARAIDAQAKNAEAVGRLDEHLRESVRLLGEVRDRLLSRPCLRLGPGDLRARMGSKNPATQLPPR